MATYDSYQQRQAQREQNVGITPAVETVVVTPGTVAASTLGIGLAVLAVLFFLGKK